VELLWGLPLRLGARPADLRSATNAAWTASGDYDDSTTVFHRLDIKRGRFCIQADPINSLIATHSFTFTRRTYLLAAFLEELHRRRAAAPWAGGRVGDLQSHTNTNSA
jgi:hypothetical protein